MNDTQRAQEMHDIGRALGKYSLHIVYRQLSFALYAYDPVQQNRINVAEMIRNK